MMMMNNRRLRSVIGKSSYRYINNISKHKNNENSYNNNNNNNNKFIITTSISLIGLLLYSISTYTSNDNNNNNNNNNNVNNIILPLSLPSNFIKKLSEILKLDQIEDDEGERDVRAKPWNSYHSSKNKPHIIVFPESTEDVSKILKLCNEYKIPVIPFAGGTSIEGQTLTLNGGLSLDFSRMKNIIELNEGDLDITVQAGLGYIELNEILKNKGLWFPLDPGPGAAIGGMCACRCSGSTAVRYGSMRENVLNVKAVLPDGTIIKTGSRARKSSAGYDLTRLLIGSEGTLAVITEATLKLHGIPKYSYALKIAFPSIKDAAATAAATLNCGVTVGRCELLDDTMVTIINKSNPNMKKWDESTTLMYEITGPSSSSVNEQLDIDKNIALKYGGKDFYTAKDENETKNLWKIRKECLWSAMSAYPDCEAMITDVCVPLTKLPELIDITRKEIDKSTLPCPIIAHAGDGNFHLLIMFHPNIESEAKEAKKIATDMAKRAIAMGGTCTGEHGVGTGKIQLLQEEMGQGSITMMEIIKNAIDPENIMNPGKILVNKNANKKYFCN